MLPARNGVKSKRTRGQLPSGQDSTEGMTCTVQLYGRTVYVMRVCPYVIKLNCHNALPAPERIAAEVRFAAALERSLGEPDAVVDAYSAWTTTGRSQASQLPPPTESLAARWCSAYQGAVTSALAGVYGLEEPTFDVIVS
jgi:hypothetical protein